MKRVATSKLTIPSLHVKEKLLRRADHRAVKLQKSRRSTLSVNELLRIKIFALRRRVWYRVLSRVERGVLDLTIRYIEAVKSKVLAEVLTAIVQKLKQATESIIDKMVKTVGIPLAGKVSELAVSWGNFQAKMWAVDLQFAAFLTVMQKNS